MLTEIKYTNTKCR